jgi:triacylglycerol lipase
MIEAAKKQQGDETMNGQSTGRFEDQFLSCTGEKLGNFLYIHGFGGSYYDNFSALRLAKHFDYYAVNLPGHGSVDIPRFDSSLEEYAYHVVAYIRERGLKDLILAGHSLGGAVVSMAEEKVRDRLSALVLINPIARSSCEMTEVLHPGLKRILLPLTLEDVFEMCRYAYYRFDNMKAMPGFEDACRATLAVQLRKKAYLQALYDAINTEKAIALIEGAQRHFMTRTLYLLGRHDRLVPAAKARKSVPNNPFIEFAWLENSGHCPQNEESAEFVRLVTTFVKPKPLT